MSGETVGYERGLRDAMHAVQRAVRPLGIPDGGVVSLWNAGYTQARDEALAAIGQLHTAAAAALRAEVAATSADPAAGTPS